MCPPPDSPHASLAGRLPSEGHAHRYAGNSGVMEALRARVSLCVWWQGTWIAGMVYNGGKGRGSQVWCAMVARDVDRRYGVQGTWEGG